MAVFFKLWAWVLPVAVGATVDISPLAPVTVHAEKPAGSRTEQSAEFAGARVEMNPDGESTLTRVLSRQTAVFAQRTGADDSQVSFQLRGQDPIQTRYYLQGIPLTDAQFQSAQLGWFPAEAMAAVEIFPQGTPAALGGDGLGGAVSLRLRNPSEGAKASLAMRLGSFGAGRLFARAVGVRPLPFSVFVDASQAREDFTFRDTNGTPLTPGDDRWLRRDHNGQWGVSLLPQMRLWKNGAGYGEVFGFHTIRHAEIPGPIRMPLRANLEQSYHLVGAHGHFTPGSMQLDWTLYGRYHAQNLHAPDGLPALQLRASTTAGLGSRIVLQIPVGEGSADFSLGVSADQGRLFPANAAVSGAGMWGVPAGVCFQIPWGLWLFKPALSFSHVHFSGTAKDRNAFAASPRMGVEWEPHPRHRFRTAFGRYHRTPSLSELYGSPSVVSPNPTLLDESALKAEGGWDGRWPIRHWLWRQLQASYTFSAALADNLIAFIPNSQATFVAQNIGRSRILVHEAGLDLGVFTRGNVRATAVLLSTENMSNAAAYRGRDLPMRPDYRLGVQAGWRWSSAEINYALAVTGPYFADSANSQRVSAFWEHGIWGSWQTNGWGTWIAELRNLTDATTVAGQEWNYALAFNTTGLMGFPAPGRRMYFTWRYDL